MKAIRLEKPRQFHRIETEFPAAPAAGEVLVRVHQVGICGTDYAGYLGKMPFYSYPRIPGHELGVEVVETGEGVTRVRPGDRCSVEPYMNCQTCFSCREGHGNCCENLKVLGVMMDGGLCEMLLVPERKLHPSATLELEQLALVETLAIGCHAVHRGDSQPDDVVLIIGAGPIGLSALEFVKLSGAHPIMMDMNPERLAFCRDRMGVKDCVPFSGSDSDMEGIKAAGSGRMPTLVIDATGNNNSMSNALHYAAFTGRVVYVGITTAELQFGHPLMHRRELTLLASRNALPEDFSRIIRLIEDGKIDTRPWITHRAAFEDMPGVFESWMKPEAKVVKAMVSVQDGTEAAHHD